MLPARVSQSKRRSRDHLGQERVAEREMLGVGLGECCQAGFIGG